MNQLMKRNKEKRVLKRLGDGVLDAVARCAFAALLMLVFGFLNEETLLAAAGEFHVAAASEEIRFRWKSPSAGSVLIRAYPLTGGAPAQGRVVWEGDAAIGTARMERMVNGEDGLFARYQLEPAGTGAAAESAQYVSDFDALPRRLSPTAGRASKKGIACLLDGADGEALGFEQFNQNIDIGGLLDLQSPAPKESFEYEGRRVGLRPGAVSALDKALQAAGSASHRVTGILLNNVSAKTSRESPLVHPLTDPAVVPIGPSAFNTATAEGVFYYRAILFWLVDRYTREDAAFGRLSGLVIGNEIQSHWSWYHLGASASEVVIREYGDALRIADLVTRSLHADFPIYVSLDHHWALSASEDTRKGFSAVEALEGLNTIAKRGGDFPWNVAFHPYPENLLDPQFWKDQSAPLRFDAPRVTFHNLEVLPAFLNQERFLMGGKARRIALTEQGFHCPKEPEGELLQAAAYALAWKKVQALPAVESFLYHRHVDHPHEHGLLCGIREHDGSPNVLGIGRKRKIWEVVQGAGTPQEDAVFAFALPVLGRADWTNVVSATFEEPRIQKKGRTRVIYDFVAHLKEAVSENLQAVEKRKVGPRDEVQESAILEHPKASGLGELKFNLEIPKAGGLEKDFPLLAFDAFLNHVKSSGAVFRVEVNGKEVFARRLQGGERVPAQVDLRPWGGQAVSIVFGVDAAGDPAYDWAQWVAPAVVLRSL